MSKRRVTDGPPPWEILDKSHNPMFETMEIKEVERLLPDSHFPVLTDEAVDAGREFVIENKL